MDYGKTNIWVLLNILEWNFCCTASNFMQKLMRPINLMGRSIHSTWKPTMFRLSFGRKKIQRKDAAPFFLKDDEVTSTIDLVKMKLFVSRLLNSPFFSVTQIADLDSRIQVGGSGLNIVVLRITVNKNECWIDFDWKLIWITWTMNNLFKICKSRYFWDHII